MRMNDIVNTLSEDVHYEVIPQADSPDGWDVRLLEEYPETVIRFGNITFQGENADDPDGYLSFSCDVVSTPDPDLEGIDENLTFQEYCGKILTSILERAVSEGTLVGKDNQTGEMLATPEMHEEAKELYNEYQSRTDDT
jgi:hypothetical protein